MINYKSFKWGYALVLTLACGLSGCYLMDDPYNNRPTDYNSPDAVNTHGHGGSRQATNTNQNSASASVSTEPQQVSHSKGPVQKTDPGPKRAAAPQIPVIQ